MSAATVPPMSPVRQSMDVTSINTIRALSMDAVQAANSGHPGTPMAMAPVAYCLWQQFLRFDPGDPVWPNHDRFVLSIGQVPRRILGGSDRRTLVLLQTAWPQLR
jgi:transketolase